MPACSTASRLSHCPSPSAAAIARACTVDSWRTSSRARWKPKVRSRHTSRRTENQPAWMPRLCSRLWRIMSRSEEHTSELQSRENLVCRLLLEKKKTKDKPQVKPDDEPH